MLGQLCSAENVEMKMLHALASILAAVRDDSVAVFGAAELRDFGNALENVRDDRAVFGSYRICGCDMRLRNNENVARRLGRDVAECVNKLVLIYFCRGDIPFDNGTEKAIHTLPHNIFSLFYHIADILARYSFMYKIFDIHTHTYPEILSERATENLGKFYNFHVEGKGTVSDLMKNSEDAGISGFLLLGVATNARQVKRVNESVAADVKTAREAGFHAYGFAGVHQDTVDFADEIDHAVSLGLCGVKLHPDIQGADIDDERFIPLYAELEHRGLPLYLHMGDDRAEYRFSEPEKLSRILDRFPDLKVFAAHFGGYKAWEEAVTHLAGRKNVWYDTSSALWAMTPEYARYLIDKLGVDNIMFGTDYPVMKSRDYLDLFMQIKLTEAERHAILWQNAADFFCTNE